MSVFGNIAFETEGYQPKYGMLADGKYFIKVNFPDSEEHYKSGNGEGMWVIVDVDTCKLYDSDAEGMTCSGVLDNDSVYYRGLNHGTPVEFEMRGENRPVVRYDWLLENYGECLW